MTVPPASGGDLQAPLQAPYSLLRLTSGAPSARECSNQPVGHPAVGNAPTNQRKEFPQVVLLLETCAIPVELTSHRLHCSK
jgi:hypothetical protein